MIGKLTLLILFILSVGSTALYFISLKLNGKTIKISRIIFFILTFGVVFISAFLLSNILSHNFQYTYIWSYSSKNLPLHLLISSFYAGQEGSFLLWALFLSIIGMLLQPYSKKHGYESLTMGLYSLILMFLMLILIIKSPFEYVWETFASNNISPGFTPSDGRGLNPILQNYWIAIHPPILFIGYAVMSVPFVFAIAGLIKKDYKEWINIAMPWTLFGAGILGLGIMLGGFWAYETLGWGGYWGWDPVENSSLFPWLISVALIHTMIVQKSTGGLQKTNYFLAIFTFLFVLYATFLTRSGILGETSVHSFVDPGKLVYVLLLVFQALFLVIGFVVFFIRFKDLRSGKYNFSASSREFALSLGVSVVLALTVVVLIGTSLPIIQEIFKLKKSAPEIAFYNQWGLPLSVLIMFINAISIYMNWKSSSWITVLKRLYIPLAISAVLTIIMIIAGVTDVKFIILSFASWFSLVINVILVAKYLRTNFKMTGAFISHLGISFLLIGTLASGGYSESVPLRLEVGNHKDVLGYKFTLTGKEQIEKHLLDREKYVYNINVVKNGDTTTLKPVVYWSSFNDFQSPFFEPGIATFLFKDIYISPKSIEADPNSPKVIISKNDSAFVPYDSSISVKLLRYDMSRMNMSANTEHFTFGAVVLLTEKGISKEITLESVMNMASQQFSPQWQNIKGTNIQMGFTGFIPSEEIALSKAEITFVKEAFNADVTVKPFINLVWLGVAAIVAGFIISIFRRLPGKKKLPENITE